MFILISYIIKVTTVPAVYFYNRGKQSAKFSGSRDRAFIQSFIDESLPKSTHS